MKISQTNPSTCFRWAVKHHIPVTGLESEIFSFKINLDPQVSLWISPTHDHTHNAWYINPSRELLLEETLFLMIINERISQFSALSCLKGVQTGSSGTRPHTGFDSQIIPARTQLIMRRNSSLFQHHWWVQTQLSSSSTADFIKNWIPLADPSRLEICPSTGEFFNPNWF